MFDEIVALPSNARWSGCQGAGPCQALAAEGGGRKGQALQGPSVPGYNRHQRADGLRLKTSRSREASCWALHHPFEIQKSPFCKGGPDEINERSRINPEQDARERVRLHGRSRPQV